MNQQQRQQVLDKGITIAIERGYDRELIERIVAQDSFLTVQFVQFGMATFTAAEIADSIITSLTSHTDDGGASQADWTPMGNLHNLRSTLRGS